MSYFFRPLYYPSILIKRNIFPRWRFSIIYRCSFIYWRICNFPFDQLRWFEIDIVLFGIRSLIIITPSFKPSRGQKIILLADFEITYIHFYKSPGNGLKRNVVFLDEGKFLTNFSPKETWFIKKFIELFLTYFGGRYLSWLKTKEFSLLFDKDSIILIFNLITNIFVAWIQK